MLAMVLSMCQRLCALEGHATRYALLRQHFGAVISVRFFNIGPDRQFYRRARARTRANYHNYHSSGDSNNHNYHSSGDSNNHNYHSSGDSHGYHYDGSHIHSSDNCSVSHHDEGGVDDGCSNCL